MPFLTVYTNAEIKDGKKLAEKVSALTADVLGKPISYVVANVVYNTNMAFGGSHANKGALAELLSIGLGNKDILVEALTNLLEAELGIDDTNNISISLNNAPASQVASGGRTFG